MAIQLSNIKKTYNSRLIIDDFNLTVNDGDFVGIIGKSGSGKSTILNILGLFETFNSGQYLIDGQPAPKINSNSSNRLIRHHINYLFQNFALVDELSVYKNLEMALKYTKLSKLDKQQQITDAMNQVDLIDREKDIVATLSGGEQQRVAIARAIIKPGNLILADEPTASLDETNRDLVFQLLKQLNSAGKTIIMVTHDLTLADRIPVVVQL
ncbi:putative bacteriocin export ABC transporter [Leuconostoc sp. MS02]|uniref:Bacteriocin export ABC transporter n=1 Tax=Leuconostoc aquikimchii TaxID=3236804 RepID=A0ABV3S5F1_9LACO